MMLKAGLDGIKKRLTPPEPVEENIYNFDDIKLRNLNIDTLPTSLLEALNELKKDKLIQLALGKHTYANYINAKTKEWNEYNLQVTQWELDKYLEIY